MSRVILPLLMLSGCAALNEPSVQRVEPRASAKTAESVNANTGGPAIISPGGDASTDISGAKADIKPDSRDQRRTEFNQNAKAGDGSKVNVGANHINIDSLWFQMPMMIAVVLAILMIRRRGESGSR